MSTTYVIQYYNHRDYNPPGTEGTNLLSRRIKTDAGAKRWAQSHRAPPWAVSYVLCKVPSEYFYHEAQWRVVTRVRLRDSGTARRNSRGRFTRGR